MAYENVTTIVDIWKDTNVVTNDLYTYFFLLCIFIIVFVALSRFDKKTVFVSASFLVCIISIYLFLAELANALTVTITVILLVISLFISIFRQE